MSGSKTPNCCPSSNKLTPICCPSSSKLTPICCPNGCRLTAHCCPNGSKLIPICCPNGSKVTPNCCPNSSKLTLWPSKFSPPCLLFSGTIGSHILYSHHLSHYPSGSCSIMAAPPANLSPFNKSAFPCRHVQPATGCLGRRNMLLTFLAASFLFGCVAT